MKQFDDATRIFRRTLALRPGDAGERRLLASIQLIASKPRDAIDTLAPILDGPAAGSATLELAASAFEEAGDTARSVSTLLK